MMDGIHIMQRVAARGAAIKVLDKPHRYANQATFAIEASADSRAPIGSAVKAAAAMWRDG